MHSARVVVVFGLFAAVAASFPICGYVGAAIAAVLCLRSMVLTRRRQRWAAANHERILRVAEEHAKRDTIWFEEYGNAPPPTYDTSSVDRFSLANPVGWLAHLDAKGFVVIAEVATPGEVETAHNLLWNFLETNTTMRRGVAASYTDEAFEQIGDRRKGICQGSHVGHSEACWFVRCLPTVRSAFEAIWETTELLTSFDGINIYRPITGDGGQRTRSAWWHVDQGLFKRGRHSIQGFVSLTDATPATGGLCVCPGTHTAHDDLLTYAATTDGDHVRVPSARCVTAMEPPMDPPTDRCTVRVPRPASTRSVAIPCSSLAVRATSSCGIVAQCIATRHRSWTSLRRRCARPNVPSRLSRMPKRRMSSSVSQSTCACTRRPLCRPRRAAAVGWRSPFAPAQPIGPISSSTLGRWRRAALMTRRSPRRCDPQARPAAI